MTLGGLFELLDTASTVAVPVVGAAVAAYLALGGGDL